MTKIKTDVQDDQSPWHSFIGWKKLIKINKVKIKVVKRKHIKKNQSG